MALLRLVVPTGVDFVWPDLNLREEQCIILRFFRGRSLSFWARSSSNCHLRPTGEAYSVPYVLPLSLAMFVFG